jgi:DNA mismatch repair protein MSH4
MTMLYKATQGIAKEVHYGLALARVVPLPPGVVEHATNVARTIERHTIRSKKASEIVLKEKRRKLILNLKEHLVQAYNGVLEGEVLSAWLNELQKEFVNRMTALEIEAANTSNESNEIVGDSDTGEEGQPSTHVSQPSVISIDSHITSTYYESTTQAMSEASTVRAVSENEC